MHFSVLWHLYVFWAVPFDGLYFCPGISWLHWIVCPPLYYFSCPCCFEYWGWLRLYLSVQKLDTSVFCERLLAKLLYRFFSLWFSFCFSIKKSIIVTLWLLTVGRDIHTLHWAVWIWRLWDKTLLRPQKYIDLALSWLSLGFSCGQFWVTSLCQTIWTCVTAFWIVQTTLAIRHSPGYLVGEYRSSML